MANSVSATFHFSSSNVDACKRLEEIVYAEEDIQLRNEKFPNPWTRINEFVTDKHDECTVGLEIHGDIRGSFDQKYIISLSKVLQEIDPDCTITTAEYFMLNGVSCRSATTTMHIVRNNLTRLCIDTHRLANKHGIDLEQMTGEDNDLLYQKLQEITRSEMNKFLPLDMNSDTSNLCGSMTVYVNFK